MPAHAAHVRLSAQFPFGADFASHARHFAGERIQLVHHRVDGVLQLQNLAAHVHGDFAGKIAARHGRGHFGDITNLGRQVPGHRVHRFREVAPRTGHAAHVGLSSQFAFRADLTGHASHFARECIQLIHHRVDGVLQLQNLAANFHGDGSRQVAARHGRRDFGDIANLIGQVRRHGIDGIRQVLPHAADAFHHRLTAELSFGADLARHARHFAGERAELVHHRVDRVLQLENLSANVHRDLAGKVAVGDGRGHLGDIADLRGQD